MGFQELWFLQCLLEKSFFGPIAHFKGREDVFDLLAFEKIIEIDPWIDLYLWEKMMVCDEVGIAEVELDLVFEEEGGGGL